MWLMFRFSIRTLLVHLGYKPPFEWLMCARSQLYRGADAAHVDVGNAYSHVHWRPCHMMWVYVTTDHQGNWPTHTGTMSPCFPILWQCPLEVCLCSWRKKTDRCMCGEACIWLKSKDRKKRSQIRNKQCFPWNTNCNRFIFVCCKTFMYIKSEYDLNSGLQPLFLNSVMFICLRF